MWLLYNRRPKDFYTISIFTGFFTGYLKNLYYCIEIGSHILPQVSADVLKLKCGQLVVVVSPSCWPEYSSITPRQRGLFWLSANQC